MNNKKAHRGWRLVVQGLPLVAVAGSAFVSLQRVSQQFSMLVVLIWVQVYFIVECYLGRS